MVDFIRLGNLLKRKLSPFEREREEKEKDLAAFKKFLVKNRPDLIAITAESREALTVADEFALCSSELAQEGVHHVIPVEVVDPSVARIYANSRRARVRPLCSSTCTYMIYINYTCLGQSFVIAIACTTVYLCLRCL